MRIRTFRCWCRRRRSMRSCSRPASGRDVVATASGSFTGLVDLNEFATGKQTFDAPLNGKNGNLAISGNGAGANRFTANVGTAPPRALTFTAYVVNTNTVLLVGIDTNRVVAGSGVGG